ncbi:MAG: class I adenylate-forming enzyme family protein [Alphaproteobacteria bacterium]|jgi:long-chain acyl-CoA synthetase
MMDARRQNNLGYFSHEPALAMPDRIAMIDLTQGSPRQVTYGEMEDRLNRAANLVVSMGLKPGDRLAMCVGNRFEFIEIMYGAMRAGIVPVTLNTKLGADVLDFTVRDSDSAAAIIEPSSNRFVVDVCEAAGLKPLIAFDSAPPGWQDYETLLMQQPASFDPPELSADHPSFQPYTSGSTGKPKGVVLTHEGQLWGIRIFQEHWPEKLENRSLAAVPMYHKNAMAGAFKPLLHVGGSVVILPDFKPEPFLRALSEYQCTNTGGVPAVYTALLQHRELINQLDLSHLKGLSVGSAPVQPELLSDIMETFGVNCIESYGLTEGGPVPIAVPPGVTAVPPGSCGKVLPEGDVKLVGTDGAESDYGEMWVRNPGVTPGYYKRPEVNAEKLVDGWLKTGDLFRVDQDGWYYFMGRTDDMFNCGGENIYPKEVENLLLAHPDVTDASVVPLTHRIKGEAPVALITVTTGSTFDEAAAKAWCLENGPAYAHPRRVAVLDALPLNGAAKIDRLIVQKQAREMFGEEIGG